LNNISQADLLNGNADIEHIIPRSRSFNDSLQNKIITHVKCNRDKGQMTALDYMMTQGELRLEAYHNEVQRLYDNNEISLIKYRNLLTPGSDVGSGFLSRQMKDTQYVVTEAVKRLKTISPSVRTTTGSVTDLLRDQWELNHVLQELVLPKYQKIGATEKRVFKDGVNGVKEFTIPKDWSKRDDHRHHAVDALIVALTTPAMIFRLNNLNKLFQYKNDHLSKEGKEKLLNAWKEMGLPAEKFDLKSFSLSESLKFEPPVQDLRDKAKMHLASILISFKKRSKAVSPKTNRFKTGGGEQEQRTLVPRGSLHNDTIHGRIKVPEKVKLSTRFDRIDDVIDPAVKGVLEERLRKYGGPKKAFSLSAIKKDPVIVSGDAITEVDVHRYVFTKRVSVSQLTAAQIKKITDDRVRSLIEERVIEKGSLKKALDSFEEVPIFIDSHRKVPVRSVTVSDEGDLVPVRERGGDPVDYVYTAGNHHVRIYKNEEGKYVDKVVSFWDAVTYVSQKYDETGQLTSPIDRRDLPEEGLRFVYDLQKNDLVVIDLDLKGLDINSRENWPLMSRHLYRVQKFSKNKRGEFAIEFRHHLESTLNRGDNELRGITWERFQSNKQFERLSKIQLNNLGEIIAVHYP
jgi:CRISPR-associated endonuclease Csn1